MIDQSYNVLKLNYINMIMFILAAAKLLILIYIIIRLLFLKVNANKKYLTISEKNIIRKWK